MKNSWINPILIAIAFTLSLAFGIRAQETQDSTPAPDEQQQKEKAEREKKAFMLLDQIADDAQLEARNNLGNMINRYGQALGMLARTDFDRAQALANRFQLTEPRIMARMAIVQGLVGSPASGPGFNNYNLRGMGPDVMARPPHL